MDDISFWERMSKIEKIVGNIFANAGYMVTQPSNHVGQGYDFNAERKGEKYAIEIKAYNELECRARVLLRAADRVLDVAKREGKIPVLAIANVLSKQLQSELLHYEGLVVIDLRNLLYMVKENKSEYLRKFNCNLTRSVVQCYAVSDSSFVSCLT